MYLLYSVLLAIGFVLALPWYLWKGRASGKYLRTFRERMGRLPVSLNEGGLPSIWIHAVSVGEVLAAGTLVAPLKERFPRHRLFLSTTTMTGNAVAQKTVRGIDGLFFAPFDWAGPVRSVLGRLNPVLLVLVETEIWPNLIHAARRRGTRVAVVNGRISPRSFGRYRRIRFFLRAVLAEVDAFLMQSEGHADRIRRMGAPPDRVRVAGNLKFDARGSLPPAALAAIVASERPLWVAGSTVDGEEELVLRAFRLVLQRVPDARLLVAPRHPERFPAVPALVEQAGFACARRSALPPSGWTDEVLVLDTLGELAHVYPLCTVAFVGGSLLPAGGHNVLEAAVAGKPVVVGPHMENFQEIRDELLAEGALVEVRTAEELAERVSDLLLDGEGRARMGDGARSVIDRNRGAVGRTVEALAALVA